MIAAPPQGEGLTNEAACTAKSAKMVGAAWRVILNRLATSLATQNTARVREN